MLRPPGHWHLLPRLLLPAVSLWRERFEAQLEGIRASMRALLRLPSHCVLLPSKCDVGPQRGHAGHWR